MLTPIEHTLADDPEDLRVLLCDVLPADTAEQKVAELRASPYVEIVGLRPREDGGWWIDLYLSGHLKSPALDYRAETLETVDTRPGCWKTLRVGIFRGNEQIGEYARNYPSLDGTFAPFRWHGQDYALYSPDYTSTRIVSLPDCRDLGGEERAANGFCPVEYYVPLDPLTGESVGFGFVAGCVWGDDCSWKIQYLDLTRAHEGRLSRDERFGYIELPDGMSLRDAVKLSWDEYLDLRPWPWIDIITQRAFRLETGEDAVGLWKGLPKEQLDAT